MAYGIKSFLPCILDFSANTSKLVPVNPTLSGLPAELVVNVKFAERVPTAVGTNVTLTVQLSPGERLVPQVLITIL